MAKSGVVPLAQLSAGCARLWRGCCGTPLAAGVLLGLLFCSPLAGQEIALPEQQQLSLYARVLPFDRHLVQEAGDEIVIGVLYQSGFRESLRSMDAVMGAAATLAMIAHVPTRFVAIDVTTVDAIADQLTAHGIHVLYIAPLRSFSMSSLTDLLEQRQIPSITGVPAYVDQGVALGIGERGGKPDILMNKDTADAIGMNFDARFLRLVTFR